MNISKSLKELNDASFAALLSICKELTAEVTALKSATYCAYCGERFDLDDDSAARVTEHIHTCEKHPMRAVEAEVARLTRLLHAANVRKDALEGRVAELERNAKWIEAHPQGVDSLNFTVFAEDMFGNWRCCACLEEWCIFDEVTPQESNIKYCPSCGSVIQAYQDYGKED